jgi:hypothetical protein
MTPQSMRLLGLSCVGPEKQGTPELSRLLKALGMMANSGSRSSVIRHDVGFPDRMDSGGYDRLKLLTEPYFARQGCTTHKPISSRVRLFLADFCLTKPGSRYPPKTVPR